MAMIQPFDDESREYRGGGDYTQPDYGYGSESNTGAYQTPGYTPDANPYSGASNPYSGSYTPPNGNTGVTGYMPGGISAPPIDQYKPFNLSDFQRTAGEISGRYSGSMDDFVNHIFPQLSQQYQGLERFGSKGDKIRLPNGEVIDAVISAGLGGRGYNWNVEQPGGGDSYSSDPLIAGYIDRMNGILDKLSQPQPINPTLQTAITKLSGPQTVDPVLMDAITKLQGMFDNPGYTPQQRALMRTGVQEPLESQRASAQQRALGRASERGLGLGSGVLEQEAQGIDQGYDRLLEEALRSMATNEIGLQNQQRMGSIGQLAGIGQNLTGLDQQRLSLLGSIGSGLQGQDLAALQAAMSGSQGLGQLPMQLMQSQIAAMNALGNQPVPQQDSMQGLIALLAGLAGQGENAYNTSMGQSGNFWGSLFSQLPNIMGAIPGLGQSSSYPDLSGVPDIGYPHA
jgi:hypothetical protein